MQRPPSIYTSEGLPCGDSEVVQWADGFEVSADHLLWNALC